MGFFTLRELVLPQLLPVTFKVLFQPYVGPGPGGEMTRNTKDSQ